MVASHPSSGDVSEFEIRRLSACSFDDAVKVWNEGFQGYFVDMTLSLDRYLSRLQREGLSPELSLLAFSEGTPAGFLLNGIRTNPGPKVAWNGGTGVSPQFRGRGVGKALMRATVDLYKELGIQVATLEAISENKSAISLYQQFGYEVVDHLVFLNHEGELNERAFRQPNSQTYSTAQVAPYVVGELEFYQESAPWQGHWQSLLRHNGEALVVSNADGAAVGYALYKKKRDEKGMITEIALHQCVAIPGADTEAIIGCALQSLYAPLDLECKRSTYNFSKSNEAVLTMLTEAGFTSFIEQVHMVRTFNSDHFECQEK
jgi:ribosomal protein S18 acetylase RimI-like enzyme